MIPTQQKGRFRVTHKDGIVHLFEDKLEWMNLKDGEKRTHQKAIDACSGDVVVGGLGLGYVVEQLNVKPNVRSITVVEIAPEVIELVWPHIQHDKAKVVCDDIFHYLRKGRKFDYGYFDVHKDLSQEQNETVVKPLRKLAEQYIKPDHIFQWRENDICKQVQSSTM